MSDAVVVVRCGGKESSGTVKEDGGTWEFGVGANLYTRGTRQTWGRAYHQSEVGDEVVVDVFQTGWSPGLIQMVLRILGRDTGDWLTDSKHTRLTFMPGVSAKRNCYQAEVSVAHTVRQVYH